MNVIKNFKTLKESVEEFPCIQIRYDDEVFADLPLCLAPFNAELRKPCLYPNGTGLPLAVEYEWLIATLAKLKKYYVTVDPMTGRITEVPKEKAQQLLRLPPDEDLKNFSFDPRGQLVKTIQEKAPEDKEKNERKDS